MNKSLRLTVLPFLLLLPWITAAQQPAGRDQQELDRLLDQWHRDAASGNLGAYFGVMTSDGVFIGTDASEYWTVPVFREWCKPHFEKKKTWDFRPFDRHIYLAGDGRTAWFDEQLFTQMGLCRGSGALVKQAGGWKIAQYVLSAAIPNGLMKQVVAMKSPADSAYLLEQIFRRHHLKGTLLFFDPSKEKYFGYQPVLWDSGYLPASTFKIPNSLIGLETGATDTSYLFRWNGEKRRLTQWEKDLTLKDAFRVSCVRCYQEVAQQIGPARMKEYLARIGYPGMDVTEDNIALFWLEGNSRVTPRQQVDFLRRLKEEKLPLSPVTMKTVKSFMLQEGTDGYRLYGKTGWAIRNGNNYGWFVGWAEAGGQVFYLACLVMPEDGKVPDDFAVARKQIVEEALQALRMVPAGQPDSAGVMERLDWLCGRWEMKMKDGIFNETWVRENDSLIRGTGTMVSGADTLFIEKLSLVLRSGEMLYIPIVTGQNSGRPVEFRLVSQTGDTWTFENQSHDFPQRIAYSRTGPDSLNAVISGRENGKPREEVFRMKKGAGP